VVLLNLALRAVFLAWDLVKNGLQVVTAICRCIV
jgi:hypothetical protein